MNTKLKYMIPAFAAIVALVFAFTPYVMADYGASATWGDGAKQPMGPRDHAITIEGFTGAIPIPDTVTKDSLDALKSQVTVSLASAASVAEQNGLTDAMRAGIGVVKNSDGTKYLAWTITSMTKDSTTNTATENIFVVDAGNAANFASTTKTFDHSMMADKAKLDEMKSKFGTQGFDGMKAKFGHDGWSNKLSSVPDTPEFQALKTEFTNTLHDLRDAKQNNADQSQIDQLQSKLDSLREQIHQMITTP